ncbi:synaptonemal complex central element protein 3 isoform X2 [Heliangelus exortis]|uniref:synaptonemal complex central element protein 3 isoform X2 n=1 Tax=Heliangelus exortis TaxID=472823 RepID=UPI003A95B852
MQVGRWISAEGKQRHHPTFYLWAPEMAESEPREENYDDMVKMVEDLNRDLEKVLEEMEKLTVQATWMAYDMVVIRTNPHLADSMRRLEAAFLHCKEEMEKKWQEVLSESKVFVFYRHGCFTDNGKWICFHPTESYLCVYIHFYLFIFKIHVF